MIGVDLFAGAGGMALGAKLAGINICLAVESDRNAIKTYRYNNPDVKIFGKDIRILKKIDLPANGTNTIVFGGPPCKGFSISNQITRNISNPSNWLFLEFIRIVDLLKPDWMVFENVRGIIGTEKGYFLKKIKSYFNNLGYVTSIWILNAADFGVPQIRHRLFIVGSKHGILVEKPRPLLKEHIAVKQAIFDLPDLPNGASINYMAYKSEPMSEYGYLMRGHLNESANHLVTKNAPHVIIRYKYILQGGNWKNIPAKLMSNYTDRTKCHTGIYHRLREDRPSVVIGNYRKNMLIHPRQDRGLSVREAARLQSFPDWYEFKGTIGFQQQQVANAVPPLLATTVFKSILRAEYKKK